MKRFFAVIGLCLLAVNAQAQQRIEAMPPQSVPSAATPAETLRDFMRAEEARTCAELKSFARDTILRDDAFVRAANSRNTRAVAAAASKFVVRSGGIVVDLLLGTFAVSGCRLQCFVEAGR